MNKNDQKRNNHLIIKQFSSLTEKQSTFLPFILCGHDGFLFIFVCADTTRMAEGQSKELWVQDLSAVSENILLAAHAMGLGACWTTIYPIQKKVNGISRTLNLPGNLIPLNGIIIGYPDEPEQPKDKWDTKKITYGIR